MNIERRPVKAVKVTVYTLLVILCWLAIGFVELDSIKYFGLLRYKFISDITLIHDESHGCLDIPTVPHTYILWRIGIYQDRCTSRRKRGESI